MSLSKGSLGRIAEYELIEEIGQGGIGTVYRATDPRRGITIALKQLKPALNLDPRIVSALMKAARHSLGLSSTGVIATLDVGLDRPPGYLVMAYAPGGSLAGLLTREPTPVTSQRAADLLAPVASSLDAAHRAGILHGGIKPSNLLFNAEGRLLPADFGYARALRSVDRRWKVVDARYAAPEEAEVGEVDARADLYALGVILYELLTRHTPFDGADAEAILVRVRTGAPDPPRKYRSDLPASVEQLVLKALARDPSRRYGTASEMVADLKTAATKLPPIRPAKDSADLTSPWTPPTPVPPVNHPWRSVLAVVVLLLCLGAGIWVFVNSKPETHRPDDSYYRQVLADLQAGKDLPNVQEIHGRLTVKEYQDLLFRADEIHSKAMLQKLDENQAAVRQVSELRDRELQAQGFVQLCGQILKGEATAPSDSELAARGYNDWQITQIHRAAEFHANHSESTHP